MKEEEGLFFPKSENKDAVQLCVYREADLRLCFRPSILLVFLRCGSNMICFIVICKPIGMN